MPKLSRWIVAYKMVEVLDPETIKQILDHDGHLGGGWSQVHTHIAVNAENKEVIEKILAEKGFKFKEVFELYHPEVHDVPSS